MIQSKTALSLLLVAAAVVPGIPALAQKNQKSAAAAAQATAPDKAAAYYNYAMGHLYAELAATYGNRGDYVNKAIDSFRAAMKADPGASFLAEELSDLYIQSNKLREAVSEAEKALEQNPEDLNSRRILGRIYSRLIGDAAQGRINEEMLRRSIEQYSKIAEKTPDDPDTWLMLGRLYKIQQNSVESEKAYKKVLGIDPNHEEALTGLAMVYADLGDNTHAAEMLQRVVQRNPSQRNLQVLAGAYEQMRDYSQAASTLRRALELQPENKEVKRSLAQNLLLSDQLDESLKLYQELAADDSKDFQSQLRISQIFRQKRDFVKAREANDRAKAIDAGNIEIRYNEVSLLEAEGKTPEAIAQMKEILAGGVKKSYNAAEKNNRVVLLERLGMLYRSTEQYPQAIETFQQIADLDADLAPRALVQVIDTYRISKDFQKAAHEADASIKKYPNDRMIQSLHAQVLVDVGRTDQAITEMKKLVESKPDREGYISIAQVYEKARKYDEMAKAIDEAEKLSTTKDDKQTVFFMRGALLEKQKKFELAEAEFKKVLDIDPDNASALNYLGYMLADRGVRLQEAQQMINKALSQDPNNGAYLDSLGWVYYRLDKLPEAENFLLRALEKYSRDPTVHDHLGDVYFKQGKFKEAIAQWQNSLEEWKTAAPSEHDPVEVSKVQRKLESAKVRQAKESSGGASSKQP